MSRRAKFLWGVGILVAVFAVAAAGFRLWTRYGAGRAAPRIGLSVGDDWYDRLGIQQAPYENALARAGANVRTLDPGDLDALDGELRELDGLLLVGGGDVDPALYGGDPQRAKRVDRKRDAFETELLRRAEARGLPVLAICRGSQMLAVFHGGTLDRLEGELAERHGVTMKSLSAHEVEILEGTRLHARMGAGPHRVSSTHGQAIRDPGPRLRVAARAPDGVIEAVELPGDRFVVGIQWHPELESVAEDLQLEPFRMLVEAGRGRP